MTTKAEEARQEHVLSGTQGGGRGRLTGSAGSAAPTGPRRGPLPAGCSAASCKERKGLEDPGTRSWGLPPSPPQATPRPVPQLQAWRVLAQPLARGGLQRLCKDGGWAWAGRGLRGSGEAELTRTMEGHTRAAVWARGQNSRFCGSSAGRIWGQAGVPPGLSFPVCMAGRPEVSLGLRWVGRRQGLGGRVPGKYDFWSPRWQKPCGTQTRVPAHFRRPVSAPQK